MVKIGPMSCWAAIPRGPNSTQGVAKDSPFRLLANTGVAPGGVKKDIEIAHEMSFSRIEYWIIGLFVYDIEDTSKRRDE